MRTYAQQKAALTRVLRKEHPSTGDLRRAVESECRRTLREWHSEEWRAKYGSSAWPDDWHRWNRALQDVRSGFDMDML